MLLTYEQWHARVERACAYLYALGVRRSDVVAYSSYNCYEYFEIRAACHYIGAVFFGLPFSLSQETYAYFLAKTRPKVCIFRRREGLDIGALQQQVAVENWVDLEQWEALIQNPGEGYLFIGDYGSMACLRKDPQQVSTYNLSSGTTQNVPKVVVLRNQNWVESVFGYVRNARMEANEKQIVFMCTVSFMTAGSTTFLPTIMGGASFVVVREDSSIASIVEQIRHHKVNRLYITPTRLIELLDWCVQHEEKLETLDNIVTGTERMPPCRLKEAIDFFGSIITVGYGMVEALPPITMLQAREYFWPGSVGRAVKGTKVRRLPDGRLAIKSRTVSAGYLDNPLENAESFQKGWFITHDYGDIDSYGYITVLGRDDEILRENAKPLPGVVARHRIFAREIEDILHEMPLVRRCAVVRSEGRIKAFVTLRQHMEQEEARGKIEAYCREHFKELLMPDEIVILEQMPVTPLGKLDRRTLAGERH